MNSKASRGVILGVSLAGTSTEQFSQNIPTCRNVTIQITNRSVKYILANPRIYTNKGYCYRPPQPTIQKNTCEVCCFSKTALVPRGVVGVLTYQILWDDSNCAGELAIMFSVPFANNWSDNQFALGIYNNGLSCNENLFSTMFYGCGPFTKSEGTGNAISHSGKLVRLTGTMSASGRSVINVELWDK